MAKVTIRGELKKASKGLIKEFKRQLFGIKSKKSYPNTGKTQIHIHYHFYKDKKR